MNRPGMVYLVGAGPGDPGLITVRGAAVLAQADVVVHDHLANSRLLELAPAAARRIAAGKSVGHCTMTQEAIQQVLIEHARQGLQVVRLKGGDPLVFGRGGEECQALRAAGIPFEIVPGVTAGVGATAYAGIPVTHRAVASAVAFVTGHADPDQPGQSQALDWPALAQFPGTLVVYMGVTHMAAICRSLMSHGKNPATPAAVIESGATPEQRTTTGTLATIADRARQVGVQPPALLVLGEVAAFTHDLAWFDQRPLHGQRIVVTRPKEEALRSAEELESLGASVLIAPAIEVKPLHDPAPIDAVIDRIGAFDWIVFASSHGVTAFFTRLIEKGLDARVLGRARLAAIGSSTARTLLDEWRLRPDLVPADSRSEGLAEALLNHATGTRILLVRASRGRDVLERELGRVAQVEQVAAYENRDAHELPDDVVEKIRNGQVDWVVFTSSAMARRFFSLLPEDARRKLRERVGIASLSPVTSDTIRSLGLAVTLEPDKPTWADLVQALVQRVAAGGPARREG